MQGGTGLFGAGFKFNVNDFKSHDQRLNGINSINSERPLFGAQFHFIGANPIFARGNRAADADAGRNFRPIRCQQDELSFREALTERIVWHSPSYRREAAIRHRQLRAGTRLLCVICQIHGNVNVGAFSPCFRGILKMHVARLIRSQMFRHPLEERAQLEQMLL
jgi:hypothetical protein